MIYQHLSQKLCMEILTLSNNCTCCSVVYVDHGSYVYGSVSLIQPEVQLAEDYDVFIPKSQLDSILVNYTRSGSLLFRKLVCAFFDDTTLANSLPNGKRKRGLNDHRKGLDQNIVGAIKGAYLMGIRKCEIRKICTVQCDIHVWLCLCSFHREVLHSKQN